MKYAKAELACLVTLIKIVKQNNEKRTFNTNRQAK